MAMRRIAAGWVLGAEVLMRTWISSMLVALALTGCGGAPPTASTELALDGRAACLWNYRRLRDGVEVPNASLDSVLTACPSFANALVWSEPTGTPFVWRLWPEEKRARLRELYALYLDGRDFTAAVPTAGVGARRDDEFELTEAQAFDLYAANAAHALALEVSRRVPWTLLDFPESNLAVLFDSEYFVTPALPGPDYVAPGPSGATYRAHPWGSYVLPDWRGARFVARPQDGYAFARGWVSMSGHDYLSSTPDQTLANLTQWVAINLRHGWGTPSIPYTQDLSGRLRRSDDGFGHLAVVGGVGCHTTRDLLQDLARSVNIPVLPLLLPARRAPPYPSGIGHGALAYRWDSPAMRIIEHADVLNANELYPDAGYAWSDESEEHARRYFEVTWATPAEASAAGLVLAPGFPKLWAGTGEVEMDTGFAIISRQAHRWYGRLLGGWSDLTAAGTSPRWTAFTEQRSARLGSARGVAGLQSPLDVLCQSRDRGEVVDDTLLDWFANLYPTLLPTREDARALVASYDRLLARAGGCDAIRRDRAAFAGADAPNGWAK